jgi:hypothetical protein
MESLFKILAGAFATLVAAAVGAMALLAMLPIAALDGWIMHLAWGWFIMPTFGVAAISWAMGTALTLFIGWLTFQISAATREDSAWQRIVSGAIISCASWFTMWIVHLWIIH